MPTEEEQKKLEEQKKQQQDDNGAAKYLEIIKELKENTVPKEKFEKLEKENAELFKAVADGDSFNGNNDPSDDSKESPSDVIKRTSAVLFNGEEVSNLEYWKNALDYRDACIEATGKDPFETMGSAHDIEEPVKIEAQVSRIREIIKEADGDETAFINLFNRSMVSTAFDNNKVKKPDYVRYLEKNN